ncbi:MAG: D-aminoacyl-tRNA deacylase [Thermodesulfobacteriota bacterium]|nr:D-aminoacyl-tRNA deacylase [Thermodesulfobacteriota bacterium]
MKAVIQRVLRAGVRVDGTVVGEIGPGILVLLAVGLDDEQHQVEWMTEKVSELRIFPDEQGRMNRSLLETGGQALVVSQFTLYGDCRKGRRPSYAHSAPADIAGIYYQEFVDRMRKKGIHVQEGVFGAHMEVELVNDGPVTLIIESPPTKQLS